MSEYILYLKEPEVMTYTEIEALCHQLHQLALDRARGSSATVDMPEFKAAMVIRAFLREAKKRA